MSAVLSSVDRPIVRKSADIFPQVKRSCRNLFGPVDRDELQRDLTSKLREIAERDRQRWNFDFGEGRPLDGELEWEESPAGECPAFYREGITTAVTKGKIFPVNCGGRSSTSMEILNQGKSRKTAARVRTKRRADLHITDFYAKRRRTTAGTWSGNKKASVSTSSTSGGKRPEGMASPSRNLLGIY